MTPNSKLEAVNIMLSSIGEAPVNRLSSGLVEAETAETILSQTSRSVQAEGWHFNRETDVEIAPTLSGEIILASNTIRADMMNNSTNASIDVVQRGQKMYDRQNHTFKVNKAIKLDVVYELDFEDLPSVARRYITVKSARILQDYLVGSPELHSIQADDEMRALIELKDFENESSDYNIGDNYDVYRVIDRIGTKRSY
jgi:hypothetical protein